MLAGLSQLCVRCGQKKDLSKFEKNRVTCNSCRRKAQQQRVSSCYKNYLRNLFTKSKSAVLSNSRNKELAWELEVEDMFNLWEKQGGRCALSGVYLTHHIDGSGHKEYNASLDRISQDEGYTRTNIQLVCYRVNILKHTLSEDMLFWWVKNIYDFSCD